MTRESMNERVKRTRQEEREREGGRIEREREKGWKESGELKRRGG